MTYLLIAVGILVIIGIYLIVKNAKKKAAAMENCECAQTNEVGVEPNIHKLVTVKNQDGTKSIYRASRKPNTNHGNYNDYDFYDEFDNLILTVLYMEMLYDFVESDAYLTQVEFELFTGEETLEDEMHDDIEESLDDQEVVAEEQAIIEEIAEEVEEQVIETEVEEQVSSDMFDEPNVEYASEPEYAPEPTYAPEPEYRSEPTSYESSSSSDSYDSSSSDSDSGGGGSDD